jgi:hypothetical protein
MLTPSFTIHEPSISAPTIAGMEIRNQAGLCSFVECGNKIDENSIDTIIYGKLCDSCFQRMKSEMERAIEEWLDEDSESWQRLLEEAFGTD